MVMKVFEQIKSAMVLITMPNRMPVPPGSKNQIPRIKFQESNSKNQCLANVNLVLRAWNLFFCNYRSILWSGVSRDLSPGSQSTDHQVAQPIEEDFFHFLFDIFKLDFLSRLAIGGQDQVVAEMGLNHVAHLVGFQSESGLGERLHHGAGAKEISQIAALSFGGAGRILAGDGGKGILGQLGASLLTSQVVGAGRHLGQTASHFLLDLLFESDQFDFGLLACSWLVRRRR